MHSSQCCTLLSNSSVFPHLHLKCLPVSMALSLKHHCVPLHSTLCKNYVSSLLLMPEQFYWKRSFGFPLEPLHWDNYSAISHKGLQEEMIRLHIPRECTLHIADVFLSDTALWMVELSCLWLCWKEIRRWIDQLIWKDTFQLNDKHKSLKLKYYSIVWSQIQTNTCLSQIFKYWQAVL